jgi:outer membrane protein
MIFTDSNNVNFILTTKRVIISVFLLCSTVFALAQKPWTLQACIDRAKTANLTIRQKQISIEQATIAVKEAQCQRLPSISATIGQSYDLGISPSALGTYAQYNASVNTFSASFSMPLFSGFRIHSSIKAAKLDLQAGIADKNQARLEVITNVIAGYLQILLNKELVNAAKEQVALSDQQYKRTRQMVDAGKLSQSELYEGNAQVAKDSSSLVKTESDLRLALVDLAQQLQLKNISGFDIDSSDISAMPLYTILPSSNVDSLYQLTLQHYPAVQSAQYRIEKQKSEIAIARSGYFPTLSLNAGYYNGYYFYYNLANGAKNATLSDQLYQNQQQIISLNLQIPIFNRLDVQHKVKAAKLDLQQQVLTLEDGKQQLNKTIQQIYYRSIAAKSKYISLQKETAALQIAYHYALKKFEVGKATAFEVNEKQTALSEATSEQVEAKYDYLFSCLTMNFYIGNGM